MKRTSIRLLLLLGIILMAINVYAMPISPQSLRVLCANSELIVITQVTDVEIPQMNEDEDNNGDFLLARAELQVSSFLKGNIVNNTINVYYPAGLTCPAPPTYQKGDTVLAFLKKYEDQDHYYTVGLSYGTKNLAPEAMPIYTQRINEILAIQQTGNGSITDPATIEWLVKCIEDPITRWEGAIDLLDIKFDYKTKESDNIKLLTNEQKRRIANAVFSSLKITEGELFLLSLDDIKNDERYLPFLLKNLSAMDQASLQNAASIMRLIVSKTGNQRCARLIEPYQKISFNYQDSDPTGDAQRRLVIQRFLLLLNK